MLFLLACLSLAEDEMSKRIDNLRRLLKERKAHDDANLKQAVEDAEAQIDGFQPPEPKVVFEPKEFNTKVHKVKSLLIDASPPGSKFSVGQKMRATIGSKKDRKIHKEAGFAFIAASKGNFTFKCEERPSRVDKIVFAPVPDDECSIRRFIVHGLANSKYLKLGQFELRKACDEYQEFTITESDIESWKIEVVDNWGGKETRLYGAKMLRNT